ncbi:Indian hedgehog protein [Porphyridium purpureum]|uniref:Indian hedgehog protein n=1 Tax=Porphyridium purpureum TaxID=35688 RepID=A0A5J4YV79_PORPP|nr:Indian hedgehog protein [Porphyridium purpureum]|eukprot:POR2802..scf227_4
MIPVVLAALLLVVARARVQAQSFKLCAYLDEFCIEQGTCAVYRSSCQSAAGGSTNSTLSCSTGENGSGGVKKIDAIVINYWPEHENCPRDVAPTSKQLVTNFVRDACVEVNGGSSWVKVTDISCTPRDCFPAFAQVQLEDGSRKAMHEINIGDRVKVSAQDGYSPVVFWGHKDANVIGNNFVRVTFEDERVLMLTANHLAYVNGVLMPARDIRTGMLMTDAQSGRAILVQAVEFTMLAKGLYMPHTAHGDLVVDGIVLSSYASVAPRMAHALLLIERVMRALGLSALGSLLEHETPWLLERAMFAMASA